MFGRELFFPEGSSKEGTDLFYLVTKKTQGFGLYSLSVLPWTALYRQN